jgi:hypothetical protein
MATEGTLEVKLKPGMIAVIVSQFTMGKFAVKPKDTEVAVFTEFVAIVMVVAPSERAFVSVEAVIARAAGSVTAWIAAVIVRVARLAACAADATVAVVASVVIVHAVFATIVPPVTVNVIAASASPGLAVAVVKERELQPCTVVGAVLPLTVQSGRTTVTLSPPPVCTRAWLHLNVSTSELALPR